MADAFFPFLRPNLPERAEIVKIRFKEMDIQKNYASVISSDALLTEVYYSPRCVKEMSYLNNCLMHVPLEKILLVHNRFFLHASFIRSSIGGLLFSAQSGVGKSTQADLWKQYDGATIINGDRAIIQKEESSWRAHGSPFAGSSGYCINDSEKVRAIILLEQALENQVIVPRMSEKFRRLMLQVSMYNLDASEIDKLCSLVMEMIAAVPVYILRCTPDVKAVEVLKEFLEKEEKRDE